MAFKHRKYLSEHLYCSLFLTNNVIKDDKFKIRKKETIEELIIEMIIYCKSREEMK